MRTEPPEPGSESPELIVQRQLDAFNARDLDTLLTIYADEAELFEFPGKRLAAGSAQLRERFRLRFAEPNLHAKLRHRIIAGETVVDHECVTRTFNEGPGEIDLVMIYQVVGGRIAKAWTIAGEKRLFSK